MTRWYLRLNLCSQVHAAEFRQILFKPRGWSCTIRPDIAETLPLIVDDPRETALSLLFRFRGNSHNPHKLPLFWVGVGGGRIASGQHLMYTEDTAAANLYVSMLDAFGEPVERFADSTGPLPGVLA
jgi:hypothetical protein